MKEETLKGIISSIQEKIGEENSGIISDDLGKLFTENQMTLEKLSNNENEINSLKDKNEKLISANGSLLSMIPSKNTVVDEQDSANTNDNFSFMDCFDEFGNFKK